MAGDAYLFMLWVHLSIPRLTKKVVNQLILAKVRCSMKKTLFFSSLCFLIVGWELKLPPTPVSAETPSVVKQISKDSTKTSPVVQPQVELLNTGTEPKQELRFKPMVNEKQTATMTMNMDMKIFIAGKPVPKAKLPASVMTIEMVVTKVDANGDIHYQFSYSDADVVGDTTLPPNVIEAMRSQVRKIVGIGGSCTVDNRGQTKAYSFVLPEGLDQKTKQMLEQMSNSLKQLSSPVPKQAVGIGAKWRVSSSPNLGGISLNQVATYQLVSLQDNVATLDVSTEQHAGLQKLNRPGRPTGSTLTLKSLDSQGQGQVTMGLNRLIPIRSTVSMNSNTVTNTSYAGQVATIDTKLFMEIALESK